MKITEAQVKHIFTTYPFCYGDNTKFQQCFYEETCIIRGIPINWENIKAIQNGDYPVESVTRKRREFVKSTEKQRDKEVEFHEEYSPSNPSKG